MKGFLKIRFGRTIITRKFGNDDLQNDYDLKSSLTAKLSVPAKIFQTTEKTSINAPSKSAANSFQCCKVSARLPSK